MTPLPRNRWKRKSSLDSEKARKMGLASQAKQRARRDAEMPERMRELAEIEMMNLPRKQGDTLGLPARLSCRTEIAETKLTHHTPPSTLAPLWKNASPR